MNRLIKAYRRALGQGRFVIGPGGLEQPRGGGIHLQENTVYYLGASSSPDRIIVTKVGPDYLKYMMYPYRKETKIERWIGVDLITKGCETWLRSPMSKYEPETAKSITNMLHGKPGKAINPKDEQYVTVYVKSKTGVPLDSLWSDAEQYGNVGGTVDKNGNMDMLEIDTQRRMVKDIKSNPNFKIVKVVDKG